MKHLNNLFNMEQKFVLVFFHSQLQPLSEIQIFLNQNMQIKMKMGNLLWAQETFIQQE